MAGRHYFLITSLPPLGELGSAPPLHPRELLERVADAQGPQAVLEALFLADDLLQREALLAGEIEQAEPLVLTPRQLRDEQPLPACLVGPEQDGGGFRVAADAVWSAYFHHAAAVAGRQASELLAGWVRFEVSLRNALAAARAKQLGLESEPYLVASALGGEAEAPTPVINEWAAAANPLAGLRILDRARWAWLTENEQWFSFGGDELAAYAAKLMLLNRWYRLAQAPADAPGRAAGAAAPFGERTQP